MLYPRRGVVTWRLLIYGTGSGDMSHAMALSWEISKRGNISPYGRNLGLCGNWHYSNVDSSVWGPPLILSALPARRICYKS